MQNPARTNAGAPNFRGVRQGEEVKSHLLDLLYIYTSHPAIRMEPVYRLSHRRRKRKLAAITYLF